VTFRTSHTPLFANAKSSPGGQPWSIFGQPKPPATTISHNRHNTCQGHTIHRLHTHLHRTEPPGNQPVTTTASQPASQLPRQPPQPANMTTNEHDDRSAALSAAMPSLPPLVQSSAAVCSALDSSPSLVGGGDCRFGDVSRQSGGKSACHTKLSVLHTTSSLRPHQLAAPLSCLS
jgi:hypothetical protein